MLVRSIPILLKHTELDNRGFMDLFSTANAAVNSAARYAKRGFLTRVYLPEGTEIVAIKTFQGKIIYPPAIQELACWIPVKEVADVLLDAMIPMDRTFSGVVSSDNPFA